MAVRLLLISCAPTQATRRAAFPSPGEEVALPHPLTAATTAVRLRSARRGPELRCARTCTALGLGEAEPDDRLADLDAGDWTGVAADEVPGDDLAAFLADHSRPAPGGESVSALINRVGSAFAGPEWTDGRHAVVASAMVVRAAVAGLLHHPPLFQLVDVPPLAAVRLSGHGGRWTLRGLLPYALWTAGGLG